MFCSPGGTTFNFTNATVPLQPKLWLTNAWTDVKVTKILLNIYKRKMFNPLFYYIWEYVLIPMVIVNSLWYKAELMQHKLALWIGICKQQHKHQLFGPTRLFIRLVSLVLSQFCIPSVNALRFKSKGLKLTELTFKLHGTYTGATCSRCNAFLVNDKQYNNIWETFLMKNEQFQVFYGLVFAAESNVLTVSWDLFN